MGALSAVDPGLRRRIIAVAALAVFMGTLDEFIVDVSLPSITRDFGVGTGEAAWVVMIYLLVVTSTLILFGKVADRQGVRRLMVVGFAVFAVGSLLCGLSGDIWMLVGARFLQGVGGSILRVVAYALVVKLLPAEVRGWGYGILSTASALGILVGTPVGGIVTGVLSWHWVFLLNVPVGVLGIIAALRVLPAGEPQQQSGSLDVLGVGFSFGAFLALLYSLNMGQEHGWTSPVTLVLMGTATLLATAFVLHERVTDDPLLDLGMFGNRGFSFGNIAMLLACMYMTGDAFLLPFLLQLDRGYTAQVAGILLLAYSVTYIPMAQLAGRLSDRMPPARVATGAMLSGAAACLFLTLVVGLPGTWLLMVYMVWAAASCAMFISPDNNNVMSNAPEAHQGSAAGVLGTATQLGSVLGVAVFEAVFSAAGVGAGADDWESVGAAPELLETGFRHAYILGIVVCLLAAAFVYLSGRQARSTQTVPELTS